MHRKVASGKWSVEAGRTKGNTEEARSVNAYLELLRSKVYGFQPELLQEGRPMTAETIKGKWLGVEEEPILLLEVFQKHNKPIVHARAYVGGERRLLPDAHHLSEGITAC